MKLRSIRLVTLCASLVLSACTMASRPTLPVDVLLTPAAPPAIVADGESAPRQPPDALVGATIYNEKCAACHGPTGEGNGPSAAQIRAQGRVVASLINPTRARAVKPSEWHDVITNGRIQNLMPPFRASLNAQERWDVQAYLWALGTSPQSIEAGRQLYQAQCTSCHGANGETPVGPETTQRALNDARFLAERSLLDISGLMLRGDPHAAIALSEAERFQVADYVRSLGYRYTDPVEIRNTTLSGEGVINLRAVNGTLNGQIVANMPVTLRVYDTAGEVMSRTAMLDAAGLVSFTELPVRPDYFYQAELDYGGGRFYGAPAQFPITGTRSISDILPVFETTTQSNTLTISELHMFVQNVGEGTVTMVEFYLFDNAGDRAFVGEEGPEGRRRTLKISVPKDAQNLRFDGLGLGKRFFQEGDVIYDSDVVVPGQRAAQITMLYELPYRNGRTFERRVFYPVRRADVIVPEVTGPGTPFTVTGLLDQGLQQTLSGNLYLFLNERPLAAGESFTFELRGQPLGAELPGSDARAIGFGLITLGLTIGLAYFVFSRMRTQIEAVAESQREQLARQIAELDDRFSQGRVKEAEYRKQRERLKAQLQAIWERS